MDLHRYQTKKIEKEADRLIDIFVDQKMNWIDQALIISELFFRDEVGKYWYFDIYKSDWYYFENTEWLLTSEPPAMVEGLIPLFPGMRSDLMEVEDEIEDATVVVPRSPHQALEGGIQKIKTDYLGGIISAGNAELVAMRHYLIDQRGLFWSVGLQSGDWFWMGGGNWERASTPPEEDLLLSLIPGDQCRECGEELNQVVICPNCGSENLLELPDLPEDVYERVLEFMLGIDRVPEPITEPWDPPGSFPASVRNRFVGR
jgi:hypothetical protein